MHKQTQEIFNSPWLKRLRISPFPIDPEQLDLESDFAKQLHDTLKAEGWRKDQALVIASSDDPRIDGQPIQGFHRIIQISKLLTEGHKFPLNTIQIRLEECATVEEYRAKRAEYESAASLSKNRVVSNRIIQKNLLPIVQSHYDTDQSKVLDYFHRKLGFRNDKLLLAVLEDYAEKLERKTTKRNKAKAGASDTQLTVPSHLAERESWNLENQPKPIVEDDATTYIREIKVKCEHCSKETAAMINVLVGDDRKLVKVAPAELRISR